MKEDIRKPDVTDNIQRESLLGERRETISPSGQEILQIVADAKNKAKYKYPGNVYQWLGDPIIPDFGDLNDPNTPCKLVVNDYYTPETSSDGDYSEDCGEILFFDKSLIIEALSKSKPNETIIVKGKGISIDYFERLGYGYNGNQDPDKRDTKEDVEVALTINYQSITSHVQFEFSTRPISSNNNFKVYHTVNL